MVTYIAFPSSRPLLLFVEGYPGPTSAGNDYLSQACAVVVAMIVGWCHCVTSTAPRHEWVNGSDVLGSPHMYFDIQAQGGSDFMGVFESNRKRSTRIG
ncbi:predicted protein [Lichtheimia corymbifera JMRC:FSU:9682]|uniref:Uncharacterized protein n=1 Tax=Lichtheimia corymbifera JMRC:FSU:9682 TaxID=1263082 RepID=A0A068SET0_9FUNG|nr:predicted protein [Lichtheimia corymbifera JMRC:FSU:9682]